MTNNPNANANIVGSTALMDQPDSAAPNGDVAEWQALLSRTAAVSPSEPGPASGNAAVVAGPSLTAGIQPAASALAAGVDMAGPSLVPSEPISGLLDTGSPTTGPAANAIDLAAFSASAALATGSSSGLATSLDAGVPDVAGATGTSFAPETVTFPGSSLVFNNTYANNISQGYHDAIITAENFYQSHFANAVTLNLTFDAESLGGNAVAQNSFFTLPFSYTAVRNALASHAVSADDMAAVASLPINDPTGGHTFSLPVGEADILGLSTSSSSGTVSLNTGDLYFFSQGSPAANGYDAVSAIEHEISEGAMGRVGGLGLAPNNLWTPLDLFRYSAPGVRDFSGGRDGQNAFFSVSGSTLLTQFHNPLTTGGVNLGGDSGDWQITGDSYGFAVLGAVSPVTATDLRVMDVLGLNTTATLSRFPSAAYTLSYFATNAGGWTNDDVYPRLLGDINGDGKADIVGFASNGVQVSLATGGGNFAAPTFALGYFGTAAGGWYSNDVYPRVLADVNGDGKADIIGFASNGVQVSLSTGGGNFAAPTTTLAYFGTTVGGWYSDNTYPRLLADVNHDGLADIVGFASNGVQVSLGTGGGNFAAPSTVLSDFGTNAGGWNSNDQYPRVLADVNGDGLADIIGFASDGVHVALATGGGNFNDLGLVLPDFGTNAGGWTSGDEYPRFAADVNGDGLADIVGFASNGVQVSLATGGGHFAAPTLEAANFGTAVGGWSSQNLYPRLLGDVSGDRLADIVGFGSPGVDVALAHNV